MLIVKVLKSIILHYLAVNDSNEMPNKFGVYYKEKRIQ